MFIMMAPIAGWFLGTSGKSHRRTGLKAEESDCIRPAFSASRIIPNHTDMIPISPKASVTAVSPLLTTDSATAGSREVAPANNTETTSMKSQMMFNIYEPQRGTS